MPPPDKIGRYRVIRRLGSGAFATVWLAVDDALDSPVAVKVLADNWAHHADIRARFEQEGRIMRRADSDQLVRVLDAGELSDGRPYMVMTYAAHGTLADRLAAGPLPVGPALRTAAAIARGVEVLHGIGVLHRDLKPSNVLFDAVAGRERVLVADLGLAKSIAHASGFTIMAGTPGYAAPEQTVPGGGIDERADVYALGAMTYHMLTGQLPGRPASERVRPSRAGPGIPASVDDVVLRALHRDPRRRWPSAAALAAALDRVADQLDEVRARRPRRLLRAVVRIPAVVASVAAVLVVGGSAAAQPAPLGSVRVSDVSGSLSIAVPALWARQLKDAGWDPAAVRLPAGHAPALLVGPDLTAWPDPASPVPGVFAGLSRSLGAAASPALPAHDGCTAQPDRQLVVRELTGRVRRWTGCAGTSISFSEVVFVPASGSFGIYVQVKQVGGADRTDEILGSLRLAGPPSVTA